MNILFVVRALSSVSGEGMGCRMHLQALKDAAGDDHVHVIDLSVDSQPSRSKNYIAFGKYKGKWERVKRILQGNTLYLSNAVIHEICDYVKNNSIDIVFLDDSTLGLLAIALKKMRVPVVAFYHDVKAELYPFWIKREKNLITFVECSLGMYNERKLVQVVNANIVLNKTEDDLLEKHYGRRADYYWPICIPKEEDHTDNVYAENGKKHLLFVGTTAKPNIEGMQWFCNQVLPEIREHYDLYIVGSGWKKEAESFCNEDVHVIGYAESLASYYEYADATIAPLTNGGGMKTKVAEALSYGKIFLGSEESLRGYYEEMSDEIKNKYVFRCDSAEDYKMVLSRLYLQKTEKTNMELVDLYQKKYSISAACAIAQKIVSDIIGKRR